MSPSHTTTNACLLAASCFAHLPSLCRTSIRWLVEVEVIQLPDTSQRFQPMPLNNEAKEIRLVQMQPSKDSKTPAWLTIKHVNLYEYGKVNHFNYVEGIPKLCTCGKEPTRERSSANNRVDEDGRSDDFELSKTSCRSERRKRPTTRTWSPLTPPNTLPCAHSAILYLGIGKAGNRHVRHQQ